MEGLSLAEYKESYNRKNTELYYHRLALRYSKFYYRILSKHGIRNINYEMLLELIIKCLFLFKVKTKLIDNDPNECIIPNLLEKLTKYYRLGVINDNIDEKLDACLHMVALIFNSIELRCKDKTPSKEIWKDLSSMSKYLYSRLTNKGNREKVYALIHLFSYYITSDTPNKLNNNADKISLAVDLFAYMEDNITYELEGKLLIYNLFQTVLSMLHKYCYYNKVIGKFIKFPSIDTELLPNGNYVIEDYFVIDMDKQIAIPKLYDPLYKFELRRM